MNSQLFWQDDFADAVFSRDPDATIPGLTGPLSAEVATAVYRNNVLEGFRETLQSIYGAIFQLIGEDCFRQTAYAYARESPSHQGDLNRYGSTFPEFLGHYPATHGLLYLPDMARLEWASHEAYQAADLPASTGLHPSVRLVESDYPLLALWNLCQNPDGTEVLDLDALGGDRVLVARPQEEVLMRSVSSGEATWYRALLDKNTLDEAAIAVRMAEHGCDLMHYWAFALGQALWIQG